MFHCLFTPIMSESSVLLTLHLHVDV